MDHIRRDPNETPLDRLRKTEHIPVIVNIFTLNIFKKGLSVVYTELCLSFRSKRASSHALFRIPALSEKQQAFRKQSLEKKYSIKRV
jgi:hypothetical protein